MRLPEQQNVISLTMPELYNNIRECQEKNSPPQLRNGLSEGENVMFLLVFYLFAQRCFWLRQLPVLFL